MARSLTSTLKNAIFAQETGEAIVTLLTIDHSTFGSPLRYCDAEADVISGIRTFVAAAFKVTLAHQTDNGVPKIVLEVDNITKEVVTALDSLLTPPTVDIEYVLESSPSTIEIGPEQFTADDITYNSVSLRANLSYENILTTQIPKDTFTPLTVPGIFR